MHDNQFIPGDDPADQRRLYGDLAWTWSIMSPPGEYEDEASEFREAILQHSTIEVHTLLDLGCGGGHNDFHLKKRFAVTGVDLSEAMLANARRLNPEVTYLQGDIRTVRLGDMLWDAVMIADAVSYMLTESDLRAAFATAFAHLTPGGVFCTYVEASKEAFVQNESDSGPPARQHNLAQLPALRKLPSFAFHSITLAPNRTRHYIYSHQASS